MTQRHVVVVGAGIIGLATAYQNLRAGARVTVIDRDPQGDKASFGNAGAIAVTEVVPASVPGVAWRALGWMLDPLGPLAVRPAHALKLVPWFMRFAKVGTVAEMERISLALAALNARVYEDLIPMLGDLGLASDLHQKGALTLYESAEGYRRDAAEWGLKKARGIEVHEISAATAREMEPALGERVRQAIFTPQWSYVSDPRKIVDRLREWLVQRKVTILEQDVTAVRVESSSALSVKFATGERLTADYVVIAAGAWSGELVRRLGERVLLESERGYNTTIKNPGITVERQLIFAERRFVATPLECGLRIGGAAEFGGLSAPPNFRRSHKLLVLAQQYLPGLKGQAGTVWAGHRPATPDSLPVIGTSRAHPRILHAFGHGHLGLTQCATTGRLIRDLIFHEKPPLDMTPYQVSRFE